MADSSTYQRFTRSGLTLALILAASALSLLVRPPLHAYAWTASAPLGSNGAGTGSGNATTTSGFNASLQVSLQGAQPSATYALFSCISLTLGGFDCVGKNNPPGLQQVVVAPKALAPLSVTLAEQGSFQVDASGSGSTALSLQPLLLPDTPASIYNVVQLINTADPTDSYTATDLQAPTQASGVISALPVVTTPLALGVPVLVSAQFPGYAYPVQITALGGYPFSPYLSVPYSVFGGSPFSATVGTCPNGQPPHATPLPNGTIFFGC